jgi:predicted porin
MEDQTLDAIENSGKAWVLGAAYDFGNIHMDDLIFGVAYGHFEADDNTAYKVNEVDAVLEYSFHEKLSLTVAFSSVKDKIHTNSDYDQLRMIANYNF